MTLPYKGFPVADLFKTVGISAAAVTHRALFRPASARSAGSTAQRLSTAEHFITNQPADPLPGIQKDLHIRILAFYAKPGTEPIGSTVYRFIKGVARLGIRKQIVGAGHRL